MYMLGIKDIGPMEYGHLIYDKTAMYTSDEPMIQHLLATFMILSIQILGNNANI